MSKVFTGQTVTFQALASTPGYAESDHTYEWNVDGTISATNPTTASFATSGLRHATVTATNTITGSTATARTDVEVIYNGWSPSLACPYRMYYPTFAVLPNGNLFVCGDVDNYGTCWETDGSSWVNRGTNPRPRRNENVNKNFIYPSLDDGRIIVVGGKNSSNNYTTNTDFYDPSSNTWSAGPPTALNHMGLANIHKLRDGRVLVMGDGGTPERPEFYNPSTDSWSLGATMPTGYTWTARGTFLPLGDDKFLMFSNYHTSACCLYDAVTDAWSTPSSYPSGIGGGGWQSGAVVGGKAYIWGMNGSPNRAMIYDIASNTCSMAATAFGSEFYGKCYSVNGGIWLDRVYFTDGSYSVLYLPDSDTYIEPAKLSGTDSVSHFARSLYFSATVGGRPFVFGSHDDSSSPYQAATIFSSVLSWLLYQKTTPSSSRPRRCSRRSLLTI